MGVLASVMDPNGPELYPPHAAAKVLRVPTAQIHKWMRTRKLQRIDLFGEFIRVARADLLRLAFDNINESLEALAHSVKKARGARARGQERWFKNLTPQEQWKVRVAEAQSRKRALEDTRGRRPDA